MTDKTGFEGGCTRYRMHRRVNLDYKHEKSNLQIHGYQDFSFYAHNSLRLAI